MKVLCETEDTMRRKKKAKKEKKEKDRTDRDAKEDQNGLQSDG